MNRAITTTVSTNLSGYMLYVTAYIMFLGGHVNPGPGRDAPPRRQDRDLAGGPARCTPSQWSQGPPRQQKRRGRSGYRGGSGLRGRSGAFPSPDPPPGPDRPPNIRPPRQQTGKRDTQWL